MTLPPRLRGLKVCKSHRLGRTAEQQCLWAGLLHPFTQQLWLHKIKPISILAWRGTSHEPPPLAEVLLAAGGFWGAESLFKGVAPGQPMDGPEQECMDGTK